MCFTLQAPWARSIEESKANARFIAKACNAHDELLAACRAALLSLASQRKYCCYDDRQLIGHNEDATNVLEAAIAKAEGTQP
jgi:hypothetical protein